MARVHAHPRSMGPKMDSLLYAIVGLPPAPSLRLALMDPTGPKGPANHRLRHKSRPTTLALTFIANPTRPKVSAKDMMFYSLGVVLFEIALWRPLKSRFVTNPAQMTAQDRKDYLLASVPLLGGAVGGTYRDVVKRCSSGHLANDGPLSGDEPKFAKDRKSVV